MRKWFVLVGLLALSIIVIVAVRQYSRNAEVEYLSGRLPPEVDAVLKTSDQVELFSLDPNGTLNPVQSQPNFEHYGILGSIRLTRAEKTQLGEALTKAVQEVPSSVPACFDPRHGIRVSQNGTIYELLICFECRQIAIYVDGKLRYKLLTSWTPVFNQILLQHHVSLPPQPSGFSDDK